MSFVVEWNHKQIAPVQVFKNVLAAHLTGDGVAKLHVEAIQNGRL